jgi:hypothetical protein
MATQASAEYDLGKKKSIGGARANWEFGDSKGGGKSAVKDVKKASGVTKASDK